MVNVFTVVGEHRHDHARLLVLGADGEYYDYLATRQRLTPVDPDREWRVFARDGADDADRHLAREDWSRALVTDRQTR